MSLPVDARMTSLLVVLALALGALAIAPPVTGNASSPRTKRVTCNLVLFATIPQPNARAANFGSARCGRPFGTGVQQDSSTVTRSSLTTGQFTGPFKMFFDRGTIRGRFTIRFVTTLNAQYRIVGVRYTGTLRVTGGTAAYRRVRGSGTITGVSADAVRTELRERLTLRGL